MPLHAKVQLYPSLKNFNRLVSDKKNMGVEELV